MIKKYLNKKNCQKIIISIKSLDKKKKKKKLTFHKKKIVYKFQLLSQTTAEI